MAAGDLITQDFQLEVGGVLVGHGTDVDLVKFSGLGAYVAATATKRDLGDGAVPGFDTNDVRPLEVDMEIRKPGDSAGAAAVHAALSAAFAASSGTGVVELHFRLPFYGHCKVLGRPRGFTDDGLIDLPLGFVECTGRFDGTEPAIVGVP